MSQTLYLDADQFPLIDQGTKRTTARWGKLDVSPGPLLFLPNRSPSGAVPNGLVEGRRVRVTEVTYTLLNGMTDEQARRLGFRSADRISEIQSDRHPEFDRNDFITVVRFEPATP